MSTIKNEVSKPETSTWIELRNLAQTDFLQLRSSMAKAYPNWEGLWTKKQLKEMLSTFPEGQLAVLVNDKVVGVALSFIVDYAKFGNDHTYEQITDTIYTN